MANGFNLPGFKPIKIESPKLQKVRLRHQGERTLGQSDKKRLKKEKGYECERCHNKFKPNLLTLHHKKHVASYKPKGLNLAQLEFYYNKKKKAAHDRDKNLMVLCFNCHKELHDEESKINKEKKKKQSKRNSNPFGFKQPKISFGGI